MNAIVKQLSTAEHKPAADLKPMMLKPDEGDPTERDALAIVVAFKKSGIQIRWADALRAWKRYSEREMFAEWARVPTDDQQVVDLLAHYFHPVPERARRA